MKPIILCFVALIFFSSCSNSVTKLFPKQPRPFQAKEFNSEQWKNGDFQIRGEMAENLREIVSDYKTPWKKSADEVRQILGKPDEITQAECCWVGRNLSPGKVETWLYYIDIENDYRKQSEPKGKLIPQAFKLYFSNRQSQTFETVIGDRDGDHSVRMPVVGALRIDKND